MLVEVSSISNANEIFDNIINTTQNKQIILTNSLYIDQYYGIKVVINMLLAIYKKYKDKIDIANITIRTTNKMSYITAKKIINNLNVDYIQLN